PRSSVIISDEALSPETGNGTEFVVLMSGEPQGGIKMRRGGDATASRYQRSSTRLSYGRASVARRARAPVTSPDARAPFTSPEAPAPFASPGARAPFTSPEARGPFARPFPSGDPLSFR